MFTCGTNKSTHHIPALPLLTMGELPMPPSTPIPTHVHWSHLLNKRRTSIQQSSLFSSRLIFFLCPGSFPLPKTMKEYLPSGSLFSSFLDYTLHRFLKRDVFLCYLLILSSHVFPSVPTTPSKQVSIKVPNDLSDAKCHN